MTKLRYCTLTGVEESVALGDLWMLSKKHPFVEWGVLHSLDRAGSGRYPNLAAIEALSMQLDYERDTGKRPNFALHLCGRSVRAFIEDPWLSPVGQVAKAFGRVQLNFISAKFDLEAVVAAIRTMGDTRVITQHNRANEGLALALAPYELANHDVLFDQSGGRGLLPLDWPSVADAVKGTHHGWAGGLGPANIKAELPRIAAAAGKEFSIDMEGSLRTEADKFDLNAALAVLDAVAEFVSETPSDS